MLPVNVMTYLPNFYFGGVRSYGSAGPRFGPLMRSCQGEGGEGTAADGMGTFALCAADHRLRRDCCTPPLQCSPGTLVPAFVGCTAAHGLDRAGHLEGAAGTGAKERTAATCMACMCQFLAMRYGNAAAARFASPLLVLCPSGLAVHRVQAHQRRGVCPAAGHVCAGHGIRPGGGHRWRHPAGRPALCRQVGPRACVANDAEASALDTCRAHTSICRPW